DHHTMTAITFPHLLAMLADAGFLATLLEHDYRVMAPWAGESFNAIVVATKPCGFPADDTALDVPGGGFGPTGSVSGFRWRLPRSWSQAGPGTRFPPPWIAARGWRCGGGSGQSGR